MRIDLIRQDIVAPVLDQMGMGGRDAENLVLLTGLAETGFRDVYQQGAGPAIGPYQCEPATYDDSKVYIRRKPKIYKAILPLVIGGGDLPKVTQLAGNWYLATAICRVHYWRRPEPLPTTLEEMAEYWKEFYNTPAGRGTIEHFIRSAEPLLRSM